MSRGLFSGPGFTRNPVRKGAHPSTRLWTGLSRDRGLAVRRLLRTRGGKKKCRHPWITGPAKWSAGWPTTEKES